jgi:hypothetical protein
VDDGRLPPGAALHLLIIWAMLTFVFGNLVMVVLHGWNKFRLDVDGMEEGPRMFVGVSTNPRSSFPLDIWMGRDR